MDGGRHPGGSPTHRPPTPSAPGAGSQGVAVDRSRAHVFIALQEQPGGCMPNYTPADHLSVPLTVQAALPTGFGGLSASQTIVYGTAAINVSGTLAAFTAVPANQTVTITGLRRAPLECRRPPSGPTAPSRRRSPPGGRPKSRPQTTPYPIFYSYTDSSDSNFLAASDSSTGVRTAGVPVTVNKATLGDPRGPSRQPSPTARPFPPPSSTPRRAGRSRGAR